MMYTPGRVGSDFSTGWICSITGWCPSGRTASRRGRRTGRPRQQLGVGALLHQAALVQHQDLVRGQDGGQAVGDHQAGAPGQQRLQRRLDERLALRVQMRGGLVQDQEARVLQDHAGDGQPLLLAAAEPVAALAHHRVVAVGQPGDEVVDVGRPAGRLQLGLGGVGAGVEQVGPHRVVEQVGLLGHHADLLRQRLQGDVAQVVAVDGDAALGGVVEPGQQVGDGGLARAAGADQRGQLPGAISNERSRSAQRRVVVRPGGRRSADSGVPHRLLSAAGAAPATHSASGS